MSLATEATYIERKHRRIEGSVVKAIHFTSIGVHIYLRDGSKIIAFNSDVLVPLNYRFTTDDDIELKVWPLDEEY